MENYLIIVLFQFFVIFFKKLSLSWFGNPISTNIYCRPAPATGKAQSLERAYIASHSVYHLQPLVRVLPLQVLL